MLKNIFRSSFSATHVQFPLSAIKIDENTKVNSLPRSSIWIRPRWLSIHWFFGFNQANRVLFAWHDTMYESFSKWTTSFIDGTNFKSYSLFGSHRPSPTETQNKTLLKMLWLIFNYAVNWKYFYFKIKWKIEKKIHQITPFNGIARPFGVHSILKFNVFAVYRSFYREKEFPSNIAKLNANVRGSNFIINFKKCLCCLSAQLSSI